MHGNLRERLERSHSKSFACVRAITELLTDLRFSLTTTREQLQNGFCSVVHVRCGVERWYNSPYFCAIQVMYLTICQLPYPSLNAMSFVLNFLFVLFLPSHILFSFVTCVLKFEFFLCFVFVSPT